MSAETRADAMNVDNTREGRWECAVCGAIGPNPDYDSLKAHAQDKHPEKWGEFTDATGIGEPVAVKPILAAIALGILASVAATALTLNLAAGLGAYVFVACLAYSILWVMGYA